MGISPRRPSLYRKRLAAVIFTLTAAAVVGGVWVEQPTLQAQGLIRQYGRKPADTGPRALGLVQLSPTGKARLIPVAIMMNGKFYDAGSYKATPVPMALDFGVVYEAFRTGVSQGLFTITQPGQLSHNWIAEGTWLPAGAKPPETHKKYAEPVIEEDSKDERPVLHRRAAGAADKDESKPGASGTTTPSSTTSPPTSTPTTSAPASTPSTSTSAPSTPSQPSTSTSSSSTSSSSPTSGSKNTTEDSSKGGAKADATKEPAKVPATTKTSDLDEPINDPNRPILRRGKPDPNARHEPFVTFDEADAIKAPSGKDSVKSPTEAASIQTFPAISDAGGPDPRSYTYDLKPPEEAIYRNKMLDLAGTLVKLGTQQAAPQPNSPGGRGAAASAYKRKPASQTAKPPKPQFENVNLRVFDLSNSNEPVLVLSARTPVPPAGVAGAQVPQEITLVARTNLEGELQKLFFAQTDSRHLDFSPRMELIDAVDADGDGRGELLFRQTSDAGSFYAIYRVTADRLWPLFEGTP